MPAAISSQLPPRTAPDAHDMGWARARAAARDCVDPLGAEQVAVAASAVGRVLAAPVHAAVALPGADTAAMDGYAVAGPAPWRIVGSLVPGRVPDRALTAGQAVEIATGALTPPGCDAVIPYEVAERIAGLVDAPRGDKVHIRRHGAELRRGELVAPVGRAVTPVLLAFAAHAGVDRLTVHRSPRVRILITGDEVVSHGLPGPGQVRDALGPMLTALLARTGDTGSVTRLPDAAAPLRDALVAADTDLFLVTGSSSKGASDHLHTVLHGLGARVLVDGVACRPGHPQLLARVPGGAAVVGLPGNPFAALAAWHTLAAPLLRTLSGRGPAPTVTRPVTGPVRAVRDGVRLVPVALRGSVAEVVDGAGPASLRAAANADALAVLGPDWTPGACAELLGLD